MKNTLSAIGHFLTTLVMPRRMKQYSRMNLFISFLIFVALSYLVIAPDIFRINHEYKTEAPDLLERTTGVIPLRNNQDTSLIPDLPTKCEISSNHLQCSFDYTYSQFALYYDTTEGDSTFHNKVMLVFDPRDLGSIEESRFDIAGYHTGVQTEADQHQLLFVFTGKELYFYSFKDPNYTYANDQAIVVPYTDAVTGITTKITSKDLTAFLATLVSQAVTDQNVLKPLTDNQSTEAVDSVPTKATLTAGHLSVEFN
jgi:hypothetical protein